MRYYDHLCDKSLKIKRNGYISRNLQCTEMDIKNREYEGYITTDKTKKILLNFP
jgi:hypothetical protein